MQCTQNDARSYARPNLMIVNIDCKPLTRILKDDDGNGDNEDDKDDDDNDDDDDDNDSEQGMN